MRKLDLEALDVSLSCVRDITDVVTGVGLILGSGLSPFAEAIEPIARIPYASIPNFPMPTVEGHPGSLLVGRVAGAHVVAMQGRFHYYEGYSMNELTFPLRVMAGMGVKTLIATCAVGGIRPLFNQGDLALVTDHINLMGDNPLIGGTGDLPRFVDMSEAYSPGLRKVLREAAEEIGVDLKEGIYAAVAGPSYETPAEVRFLSEFADFVGMSLAPEVIVGRQLGMEISAVAVITNAHNGGGKVSHHEVLEVAEKAGADLKKLLIEFIGRVS